MQGCALGFVLGQGPRRCDGYFAIDAIGNAHDVAQGAGIVTRLKGLGDGQSAGDGTFEQSLRIGIDEFSIKEPGEESRATAGNINVFPDQVAIHLGNEILQVQVDIFHRAVEFGRVVVAQVFGIDHVVNIAPRSDESAARLAHLLAVHGEETMREQFGRCAETGMLQHCGPEQRVKVEDVLSNEVV